MKQGMDGDTVRLAGQGGVVNYLRGFGEALTTVWMMGWGEDVSYF